MKHILYVKTNPEPFTGLDRYEEALSEHHHIHVVNFASRDQIPSENVSTHGVTDLNIPAYLRLVLNLLFFPEKEKIDIVFSSHREWVYGVLNVLFATVHGKASVVCMAGNIFNSYKYKRFWLKRQVAWIINMVVALPLLRHADKLLPYNSQVKQELVERGFEEDKIEVVRLPVDYQAKAKNYEEVSRPEKISEDKNTACFAGTLTKGKGMETFLSILQHKDIRESYQFILAGKDRDGYGEQISKYECAEVLGRIPEEEVYRYYHHSDLFLFPSYSEGFPKVILEAFTCGLPVVSRDISDIDLLAMETFSKDQELTQLLRGKTYQRHDRALPHEFQKDYVTQQYLSAIEEIDVPRS